jgi:hypothetical protein
MKYRTWVNEKIELGDMEECLADRGPIDRRRRLLLIVGFCRNIWDHFTDQRSRAGVEYAEALSDDPDDLRDNWPSDLHIRAPQHAEWESPEGSPQQWTAKVAETVWGEACTEVISDSITDLSGQLLAGLWAFERGVPVLAMREMDHFAPSGETPLPPALARVLADHCELMRCVFGNPFRPVSFSPRWRSADAVGLARGIYDDRAFDRLPILADALLDAGCDNRYVLDHCRGPGPHTRGCWVVDQVLGRG